MCIGVPPNWVYSHSKNCKEYGRVAGGGKSCTRLDPPVIAGAGPDRFAVITNDRAGGMSTILSAPIVFAAVLVVDPSPDSGTSWKPSVV